MPTLGEVLRAARQQLGYSLRDVERQTGGKVSNGYLSLMESDEVKQPSPNHLHHIAQAYGLAYTDLMQLAGYYMPAASAHPSGGAIARSAGGHSPAAATAGIALSAVGLTPDDIRQIEQYADFLRRERASAVGRTGEAPARGSKERRGASPKANQSQDASRPRADRDRTAPSSSPRQPRGRRDQ